MEEESHDVSLTIPASPGYLVLARLALSAVCRLTSLEAVEVADLKLAITEAANEFVEEDGAQGAERTIDFTFGLAHDQLVLTLAGERASAAATDQELSRAIIEATVDESRFGPRETVLIKGL